MKSQSEFPGVMVLHLTMGCNSECRHCAVSSSAAKLGLSLTPNEIKNAVYSASRNGIKAIEMSGGEPFLRYDLMDLVLAEAGQYGLYVFVATNASWAISQKVSFAMLSRLKQLGLKSIQVSVDSYHAEFTPISRVKMAIRACLDLELPVEVSITDNKSGREATLASLGELAKYGQTLPMRMHNAQPPGRIGRGALLPEPDLVIADGGLIPMSCSHFERHAIEVSVFPGRLVSFCCGPANPRLVYSYPGSVGDWLSYMYELWETDAAINWLWSRGLASACAEYYGFEVPAEACLTTSQIPCNLCFEVLPRLFPRKEPMFDIRSYRVFTPEDILVAPGGG